MQIDLRNKIVFICGLNNSGKTWFTINGILPNYRCMVHDPLKQYPKEKCHVYYPKSKIYPGIAKDNEIFLEKYVRSNAKNFDLLIYEEASRTFPNGKSILPVMRDFLDTYRHWNNTGFGVVFICRRPAQIFTDIPELAHIIISFGNKGTNDISRLNAESSGLGDLASQLSDYKYVIVDQDRTYKEMPPI